MSCKRIFFLFSALALFSFSSVQAASHGLDHAPGVSEESILYYKPSQLGGLVFAILYCAASIFLFINVYSWKDWWALCLPIGALFEGIGFAIRGYLLRDDPGNLPYYISQDMFIVLAPAAYLAFNYATFGHFAAALSEHFDTQKKGINMTLLPAKRMGLIFVCSDVVTFIVQAGGGGMQVSADLADTGSKIFLTGVILQFISYVVFLGLVIRCHVMCRNIFATSQTSLGDGITVPSVNKFFIMLYFSSLWIIVRSIYRTLELAGDRNNSLITNEIWFFLLDCVPLLLAISIYIPFYPTSLYPFSTKFPMDSRGSFIPLWDVAGKYQPRSPYKAETHSASFLVTAGNDRQVYGQPQESAYQQQDRYDARYSQPDSYSNPFNLPSERQA